MKEVNVREIIIEYLRSNGFDGLYNPNEDCGCQISDLMPCDEGCCNCIPGYKIMVFPGFDFRIVSLRLDSCKDDVK
jgi:hypothetical protein